MSDYAQAIVAYLKTDTIASPVKPGTSLEALATGGIYNYPDTGRKGLTRLLAPVAFSERDGMLKPAIVVLQLKEVTDLAIIDPVSGFNSTVTPVNIWIYDKGTTEDGYENIRAINERMYLLLAYQQLTGMFQILFDSTIKDKREPDLKEAAFYVAKYKVYGSSSFS